MIILFTKNKSLSSKLIRLVTWSPWSHVALVNATSMKDVNLNSEVIDSTFLHGGVNIRLLSELLENANKWAYIEIDVDKDKCWNAALSQLGKPYDWTALVGIFLHRNWGYADKWFCNELVEWCLAIAHKPRFRTNISRLTPGHSWMITTDKEPVLRDRSSVCHF